MFNKNYFVIRDWSQSRMWHGMCAQQRLDSVCVSALYGHSLRCPNEETLHSWLSKNALSEDSDQTAQVRSLI